MPTEKNFGRPGKKKWTPRVMPIERGRRTGCPTWRSAWLGVARSQGSSADARLPSPWPPYLGQSHLSRRPSSATIVAGLSAMQPMPVANVVKPAPLAEQAIAAEVPAGTQVLVAVWDQLRAVVPRAPRRVIPRGAPDVAQRAPPAPRTVHEPPGHVGRVLVARTVHRARAGPRQPARCSRLPRRSRARTSMRSRRA